MADLIGQTLGRYQVLEKLGEGGMATVYKAYDSRLERFVAIKVIRTDQFAPSMLAEILKRFEREAKALAKLSHPNIVHVHDYGEFEGAPYLVMEYLPSGTLKQRPDRPVPWRQAVGIVVPIAHALAYAHEHNVIHRDIKPANILLTEKGEPMLSDFGIAKILGQNEGSTLTGSGISIGTPEYMAPEQWTGESGPQSDIYCLGAVLFEMLTGRKPYMADTPVGVMLKQVSEPLPRPREFVPELPAELESVLLKALEKRPEDRFQSMSEFAEALEHLAGGQGLPKEAEATAAQTGKTLLASGEAIKEIEAATAAAVNAGKAGPPGAPGTSGMPERTFPPRAMFWRRRMPYFGLGVLILCVGLVVVATLVINGLRGRNSPSAGPTQPIAQILPTQSPHPPVKVLWDISHGPRKSQDGSLYNPDGLYQSLVKALASEGFSVTAGDLSQLDSYDILVISEASMQTEYTTGEADKIE